MNANSVLYASSSTTVSKLLVTIASKLPTAGENDNLPLQRRLRQSEERVLANTGPGVFISLPIWSRLPLNYAGTWYSGGSLALSEKIAGQYVDKHAELKGKILGSMLQEALIGKPVLNLAKFAYLYHKGTGVSASGSRVVVDDLVTRAKELQRSWEPETIFNLGDTRIAEGDRFEVSVKKLKSMSKVLKYKLGSSSLSKENKSCILNNILFCANVYSGIGYPDETLIHAGVRKIISRVIKLGDQQLLQDVFRNLKAINPAFCKFSSYGGVMLPYNTPGKK